MSSKITYSANKNDGESQVYIEYNPSNDLSVDINCYIPPKSIEDSGYHQTISIALSDLQNFVDRVHNNLTTIALERESDESHSNSRSTHRKNI